MTYQPPRSPATPAKHPEQRVLQGASRSVLVRDLQPGQLVVLDLKTGLTKVLIDSVFTVAEGVLVWGTPQSGQLESFAFEAGEWVGVVETKGEL